MTLEKLMEEAKKFLSGPENFVAAEDALRPELARYDAERRFGLEIKPAARESACRCGEVITGRIRPQDCPMFERACTPDDPLGPCMVSSEGACAAAYKYME